MAKCANCGWDWFKHGSKNQCRGLKPDPITGKKPRFQRIAPRAKEADNGEV